MGLIPWTIKSVTIKGIILSHCLHSYPLQTQISKFWSWRYCLSGPMKSKAVLIFTILHFFKKYKEKQLNISSFYTCVPKITIAWCTVLEIWSKKDPIFGHFGHFLRKRKNSWRYYQFIKKYHKWQSYHVWFLSVEIWNVTDRIFCHFGPFFCPFSLPP